MISDFVMKIRSYMCFLIGNEIVKITLLNKNKITKKAKLIVKHKLITAIFLRVLIS